jgi:hypothetical protein
VGYASLTVPELEIGGAWDEARALAGLGRGDLAAGRINEAERNLRQALEIFPRIGAAGAAVLTAGLDRAARPRPGGRRGTARTRGASPPAWL